MLTESRDNEHTESPMLVPETPEENYEDAFESESKSGESEGRAVATQQENSNEVANNTDYADLHLKNALLPAAAATIRWIAIRMRRMMLMMNHMDALLSLAVLTSRISVKTRSKLGWISAKLIEIMFSYLL